MTDTVIMDERNRWEYSEGIEVEGRYAGLKTLFVNAAAKESDAWALISALQSPTSRLWQYQHVYISRECSKIRAWQKFALAWIDAHGRMAPATLAVKPENIETIAPDARAHCHIQLVVPLPVLDRVLKATDEVCLLPRELVTYSFAIGDAAYTEPVDYLGDVEVKLQDLLAP